VWRRAGQMAGPIGLKFFVDTQEWRGGLLKAKKFQFFFPRAMPGPSAIIFWKIGEKKLVTPLR